MNLRQKNFVKKFFNQFPQKQKNIKNNFSNLKILITQLIIKTCLLLFLLRVKIMEEFDIYPINQKFFLIIIHLNYRIKIYQFLSQKFIIKNIVKE